jgi:uncharacterized protein (DUF2164 family)
MFKLEINVELEMFETNMLKFEINVELKMFKFEINVDFVSDLEWNLH